jgi:hypothetical protein
MLACGSACSPSKVLREIERFPSSTKPARVETDAGIGFVKGLRNPMGPQALVSELVAGELAHWLGLSVPPFAVIRKCDIELRMDGCPHLMEAPLFFSKQIDGFPRDGSDLIVSKVRAQGDIAKLVVFDTWVRNTDRYGSGMENSDNLFYSPGRRGRGKYDLVPIDHTHCFVDEFPTDPLPQNVVEDPQVLGFFPEFRPYVNGRTVKAALDKLSTLERGFVEEIVNSVPREWGLGHASSRVLVDFVCRRAAFVVGTLTDKIVDDPVLPGIEL